MSLCCKGCSLRLVPWINKTLLLKLCLIPFGGLCMVPGCGFLQTFSISILGLVYVNLAILLLSNFTYFLYIRLLFFF
jgi:hypothetical protein